MVVYTAILGQVIQVSPLKALFPGMKPFESKRGLQSLLKMHISSTKDGSLVASCHA